MWSQQLIVYNCKQTAANLLTIFFFFQEEEKEANSSGGLKNPDFVPKSIFEKNTSPSLQKP